MHFELGAVELAVGVEEAWLADCECLSLLQGMKEQLIIHSHIIHISVSYRRSAVSFMKAPAIIDLVRQATDRSAYRVVSQLY